MSGEALGVSGRMLEGQSLTAATVGAVTGLQWQVLSNGQWVNVGPAGSATYTLPSGSSGKSYRITGSAAGTTVFSDATPAVKKDTGSARTPAISGGLLTSNATEQAAPLAVLAPLTVTDADSTNFNGGSLTVLNSNALSRGGDGLDTLSVLTGSGQGQFSYNPSTRALSYGLSGNGSHTVIGTVDAARTGVGTDFSVTFSSSATKAVVDALVDRIAFRSTDDSPLPSRLLTLQVTDSTARVAQQSHIVNVAAVNDLPVFAGTDVFSAAESQHAVGTIIATDADAPAEPLSFALVSGAGATHNGLFSLGATDGMLRYLAAPDFESGSTVHSIRVRVTDSAGGFTERNYAVNVQNVNEAPVLTQPMQLSLSEDAGATTVPLTWSDPDGGTPTVLIEAGPALGTVSVAGTTVTFNPGNAFQSLAAGGQSTQTFSVRLTDAQGAFSTHTAAVTVTGVNDAPVITGLGGPQGSVEEQMTGRAVLNLVEGEVAAVRGSQLITIARDPASGDFNYRLMVVGQDGAVTGFGTASGAELPADFQAMAMVADPAGAVLVAGRHWTPQGNAVAAVRRYTASGVLDAAFGTGGQLTLASPSAFDPAQILLGGDGGIYVMGGSTVAGGSTAEVTVARMTAQGVLDPAFGAGGVATIGATFVADQASAALDAQGGVIIATRQEPLQWQSAAVQVHRLSSGGVLDAAFGTAGTAVLDTGTSVVAMGQVQVAANGMLLLPWSSVDAQGNTSTHVARFVSNGALDVTYGSGGIAHPATSGLLAALDASGGLLLAGAASDHGFDVMRLTAAGQPDAGFGSQGLASSGALEATQSAPVTPVALGVGVDGSIWVHGQVRPTWFSVENAVALFDSAGLASPTLLGAPTQDSATGSFAVAASDVDAGSVLSWFGSAQGAFGQLVVDVDGHWGYQLDAALPATQALTMGQTAFDSFTVEVRDSFGASTSAQVQFAVTGS